MWTSTSEADVEAILDKLFDEMAFKQNDSKSDIGFKQLQDIFTTVNVIKRYEKVLENSNSCIHIQM